jgi:hypothetical protein
MVELNDVMIKESKTDTGVEMVDVTWTPTNEPIPERLEYLVDAMELPVARTNSQAMKVGPGLIHYRFTETGLWCGMRCPKKVWELYQQEPGDQ